jgi:hypothetical protein
VFAREDGPAGALEGLDPAERSGFDFGLQHFSTAIETGRADVMAQMRLAGGRLDREAGLGERLMGAMHAALGRRLLVLLNGHGILLKPALRRAARLGAGRLRAVAESRAL